MDHVSSWPRDVTNLSLDKRPVWSRTLDSGCSWIIEDTSEQKSNSENLVCDLKPERMALRFAQGLPESFQVMLTCIRGLPTLSGHSSSSFFAAKLSWKWCVQPDNMPTYYLGWLPLLWTQNGSNWPPPTWGGLAEVNATHFLENHSTVPVPKAWKHWKVTAIIMQFGGGEPLAAMQYADVCSQLKA